VLSHVNEDKQPGIVNVSDKPVTKRFAHARSCVQLPSEIARLFKDGDLETMKGPVFRTAIIAGIMGAKKTSDLIPLCHPLGIENCDVHICLDGEMVVIDCMVTVHHKTGVEMEALTGASVAALTIYDMCKAMSHDIVIRDTRLIEKRGGKSDYHAEV
jgi:cyclic pyranopterin phosphate synthase